MNQRANKLTFGIVCLCISVMSAQKDAKAIYEGNNKYNNGQFPQSVSDYDNALKENPNNRKANFNLGAAIYRNAKLVLEGKLAVPEGQKILPDSLAGLMFDKSAEQFAIVANSVSDKDTLHQAWHNIGNCYLSKKDYPQAVTAYKKALRYDSKDEETRYNLAYALKHMPPENKKGGGAQNQQQNNQNKEEKQEQKQAQKPQNQMSKEQAEQLLKAMMEAEKKQQDKRKLKQEDASLSKPEKDW